MDRSLRTRWQPIENGYPPHDSDSYYGDRYSVPVLAGNSITGQVATIAYCWDYQMLGWVFEGLNGGPDPCNYEVQHVSHWALWPKCKLVTLD